MFSNEYVKQRMAKASNLKEAGINPYAHNAKRDTKISEFLEKNKDIENLENKRDENRIFTVAGRVKFLRLMGKAAFFKIEDESGILQVYMNKNDLGDNFNLLKKNLEVGDIVEVSGYPFITKTGELTIHAKVVKILTKAVHPLPEKFHGLQDVETKYRQRYLDMIMNKQTRERFKLRSKIVSLIREFFLSHGFLEVETPMLHTVVGGANARPFMTHHNALDIEMNLRIAPELFLKRLIVGGFEAVFELNRNFRNEGIDQTHNPEFTMLEYYWAYHNMQDLMNLTKELFNYLLEKLHLPKKMPFGEREIDFNDWKIITYKDALIKIGNIPENILEDIEKMKKYLKEKGIEIEEHIDSRGKLWAELFDEFVEDKLINPTFITRFPIEISPLARRSDENPEFAERFELFIAGREIANGFNELNDPMDQYERFKAQLEAKAKGDEEVMDMDYDYIRALQYGMPPTAGEGIGIDRLVMLLTNTESIKDVILFPTMKPKKEIFDKDDTK
ncbi:lysine--tRNA ligase [Lebetimonas sp. JH369]|uniref:lysine--tRNA ligase n=1 Tax=Lebetimonas sp. JH369 TaxID=990069 RepID=UPI0004635366|nr:lysine--tRNA ligase [Lebetimonas sp. JH369]